MWQSFLFNDEMRNIGDKSVAPYSDCMSVSSCSLIFGRRRSLNLPSICEKQRVATGHPYTLVQ